MPNFFYFFLVTPNISPGPLDDVREPSLPEEYLLRGDEDEGVARVDGGGAGGDQTGLAHPPALDLYKRGEKEKKIYWRAKGLIFFLLVCPNPKKNPIAGWK